MTQGALTILIVDDEYSWLEVLALLLEAEGFRVLSASDGEEALNVLMGETPDIVLTDYMMPRMDGLGLCTRIQDIDRLAAVPVVLMTATYETLRPHPRVATVMQKPFLFDDLLAVLRRLLAG